jgi:ribosome-binding factor A
MEPDSRKPNERGFHKRDDDERPKRSGKRSAPKRDELLEFCGEIGEGDGIDPRKFFEPTRHPRKTDHKGMQLCRQVARAVEQALAGELRDDLLRELRVRSVRPAPDAKRLLVTVEANAETSVPAARERLSLRAARLRCEVAAAITRNRAPVLVFEVIAPDVPNPGDEPDGATP